jgi:hypothetical protein
VRYELSFYILEDSILHSNRRENFKPYIVVIVQDSRMPLYREVYRRFLQPVHGSLVPNITVGLARVCSSKYAFLSMYTDTVQHLAQATCSVASLRRSYIRSSHSLGLALNCPYKAFFNYQ